MSAAELDGREIVSQKCRHDRPHSSGSVMEPLAIDELVTYLGNAIGPDNGKTMPQYRPTVYCTFTGPADFYLASWPGRYDEERAVIFARA
jgi:hypothetical protein